MINWMESVEFAHHTKGKSDHDLGCFLVHFGCNFPCATYFEGSEIEQLLSFHFLVSLNANQKGLESLNCRLNCKKRTRRNKCRGIPEVFPLSCAQVQFCARVFEKKYLWLALSRHSRNIGASTNFPECHSCNEK
ncbi:unnamed protein product [Albugo candida]|uniref:Uncharacterized protein n=1 Tax=Albugo candida TaxID=65357 RepID=A0A024FVB9_9STRA|nr:unnamed protein product [Albugo candida]|eukprot:CCI10599.1 unnamed protein product [Albugo candida]